MRFIISAPVEKPNVFQVSKVETVPMFGLKRLTFSQDKFDPYTDGRDNVEYAQGDIFAMYADLFDNEVPTDTPMHTETEKEMDTVHCDLICNANKIKIGGSYKLITAKYFDSSGHEITDEFIPYLAKSSWTCYVKNNRHEQPDEVDITDNSDLITWLEQNDNNKIKIKFADNKEYLTKILVVKCSINKDGRNIVGEIQLQISSVL
ncbi:MAG TPA: hypothetical protein DCW90_01980 [Lachnospiraceae bacterium]|nr:hypothetical protein [Lachnospiraceae bacterium]